MPRSDGCAPSGPFKLDFEASSDGFYWFIVAPYSSGVGSPAQSLRLSLTPPPAALPGNLSGLLDALEFADLPYETLDPESVRTIFAPDAAAFDALRGPDGAFFVTPAEMRELLVS